MQKKPAALRNSAVSIACLKVHVLLVFLKSIINGPNTLIKHGSSAGSLDSYIHFSEKDKQMESDN